MVALPRSLRFRRVFHDSSSYGALLNRRDDNHDNARAILGNIINAHYRSVTTNVILIEAHALILSDMGTQHASQFLRNIWQCNTLVVRVRASDEERAQEILFRYTDKEWSFADATLP
jgi:predicted nucleic acid-binding protein